MRKTYGANDKNISVNVGETFALELQGNPTTGYQWELELEPQKLKLLDQQYDSHGTGIGASGVQRFVIEAVRAGKTEIRASYKRSWETSPAEEQSFKINIRPGS